MTNTTDSAGVRVGEVAQLLEAWAPPNYQESYDNSGLLVGNKTMAISKILIALDCTEAIIEEAIEKSANMVVVHHPIVFRGLKRFNGGNYVQRVVEKAIKNDIAIYAIHTNADNIEAGVNKKIGEKLGIPNGKILQPKNSVLRKLTTFVPEAHLPAVQSAVFSAGAGSIGNYDECSFSTSGNGTFRAGKEATPYVGKVDERHSEVEQRLEVTYHQAIEGRIIQALLEAHPYEEVAYDCVALENSWRQLGSGMIGELSEPQSITAFFDHIKSTFDVACIHHTPITKEKIQRIAWCGGSGSFLLPKALAAGADLFITADFKYHEFFDAENKLVIADIGHYESEQFTIELLHDVLKEKLPTFALLLTECNTNPVNYY